MRSTIVLIFTTFLLLIAPSFANAQQVRIYTSDDSVSIGQQFQLSLVAKHNSAFPAIFPEIDPGKTEWEDILVLGIARPAEQFTKDGAVLDSIVYNVATFALDTATVSSIPVKFVSPAQDTMMMGSPWIDIFVNSYVDETSEDIAALTPLAEFPESKWPIFFWIAGLLIAAGIGYYWYKNRPEPEEALVEQVETPIIEKIDPLIEAHERLLILETQPYDSPWQIKAWYVDLSSIVRTYLERKMEVPALETTTWELMQNDRFKRRVLPSQQQTIKHILSLSDQAKFAKHLPTVHEQMDAFKTTNLMLHLINEAEKERENTFSNVVAAQNVVVQEQEADVE